MNPDITRFYPLPPDLIKKEYHFFFSTRRIRASDKRVRAMEIPMQELSLQSGLMRYWTAQGRVQHQGSS